MSFTSFTLKSSKDGHTKVRSMRLVRTLFAFGLAEALEFSV